MGIILPGGEVMRKVFLSLVLLLGALLLAQCSLDNYQIPKGERFISDTKIEFQIAIGYDSSIEDIGELLFLTRDAFNEIERQLNIRFVSAMDSRVTIGNSMLRLESDCSDFFESKKIKYDVALCLVKGKLLVIQGIADGLYFPTSETAIVSIDDLQVSTVNTIMHELGHFLGANHSKTGLMTAIKELSAYTRYLQFSRTSIKQIKNSMEKKNII